MRDTVRLSVIILLFATAPGNMAVTQAAPSNGAVSEQAKAVLGRAIKFLGGIDNIRALKDIDCRKQISGVTPYVADIQYH
jgi:hypothetical protein